MIPAANPLFPSVISIGRVGWWNAIVELAGVERILQNARAKTREDLCKMAREGSKPGWLAVWQTWWIWSCKKWDTFQKWRWKMGHGSICQKSCKDHTFGHELEPIYLNLKQPSFDLYSITSFKKVGALCWSLGRSRRSWVPLTLASSCQALPVARKPWWKWGMWPFEDGGVTCDNRMGWQDP